MTPRLYSSSSCSGILAINTRSPPVRLQKRILNSPCLLNLFTHTKHKTIRWNLGPTTRLHFLEGELIHWIDKAKNERLIVGKLPIKAGLWDAPHILWYFSQSNKHEVQRPQHNPKTTDCAMVSTVEVVVKKRYTSHTIWRSMECKIAETLKLSVLSLVFQD